jgi:hypothetical protein
MCLSNKGANISRNGLSWKTNWALWANAKIKPQLEWIILIDKFRLTSESAPITISSSF